MKPGGTLKKLNAPSLLVSVVRWSPFKDILLKILRYENNKRWFGNLDIGHSQGIARDYYLSLNGCSAVITEMEVYDDTKLHWELTYPIPWAKRLNSKKPHVTILSLDKPLIAPFIPSACHSHLPPTSLPLSADVSLITHIATNDLLLRPIPDLENGMYGYVYNTS